MPQGNNTADREIVITRMLNAPQALVFDVWTDAKHRDEWWGPTGFTTVTHNVNMKPGGEWNFIMHGPDGTDYPNRIRYIEIVKPERISYTHDSGVDNDPKGFEVTVTFEAQGDKTKLTLRSVFMSTEQRNLVVEKYGAIEGGNQTINRFEAQLAKASAQAANELSITRHFKAPRELVFEMWANPEHIKNWWGPNGFTNTISKMDVRPGGDWELIMHGPDGTDYRNRSTFVEVLKPEKIVFDHVSGPKYRMSVTFEEQDNGTLISIVMVFESAEQLKAVIETFKADDGLKQNMDKLEAYLPQKDISDQGTFTIERTFNAPVEKVWSAITDRDEMSKWYFDLKEFRPVVGFEFEFIGGTECNEYRHLCKVTEVETGRKLTYSWRYDGYAGNSFVTFELFPDGGKTRLVLTHTGLATFPASNPDLAKHNFAAGWTDIIGRSLPEYLEQA